MIWQGVALLPFIERERLLAALEPRYAKLTPFEVRRNTRGSEVLFVSDESKVYESLIKLYTANQGGEVRPLLLTFAENWHLTTWAASASESERERRFGRLCYQERRFYPRFDLRLSLGGRRNGGSRQRSIALGALQISGHPLASPQRPSQRFQASATSTRGERRRAYEASDQVP